MTDFEFRLNPETLEAHVDEVAAAYHEHGLVVLRGFLDRDHELRAFRADLKTLFTTLLGAKPEGDMDLEELIWRVFGRNNLHPRYVHDLGSHPMKILSGNLLKYQPAFRALSKAIFGPEAMIASPTGSDNLLFFFPGKAFEKYSLPLHQDFPYIMQSAAQLTIWIPLTLPYHGVGGFKAWLGSHKLGICKNHASPRGLEVDLPPETLAQYPEYEVEWSLGDVVFMNSLILHQSVPNTTADKVRAIQVYRFSNLLTDEAKAYFWQSTNYTSPKGSVKFEDVYPNMIIPAQPV